jgi:site-specific DNA-methyltransferase (adenine-specific)
LERGDKKTSLDFYSVKEILGPNLIKLNTGIVIRLIGVKPREEFFEQAIDFLRKKIGKGKILLKFDEKKYDSENNLLAYVYMKNKTFINAHLIKNGYAEIDLEFPFKYQLKFEKLIEELKLHAN